MEKLFTPIKIGNLELKNRFVMAPMENGLAEVGTGEVTQKLIDFFVERVKNEVSMIITGSIGVSPEGRGLPTQLSLFEEKHVAGHKRLVDAIHNAGGKIAAQIYHAGRQASEAITGLTPLAPSAIPCSILGNHPKEITLEEMEKIKEKFVKSAKWAVEAGYDLVEVHFAHGYLLHSFLSPHSNHRNDEYNGSLENRMKYPMAVLEAVIEAVGNKVPVTIRISADEYLEDGLHFAEVKEICKAVEKVGCKAVSLTAGSYDSVDYAIQPMYIPSGFLVPFARELKEEINIPVMVADQKKYITISASADSMNGGEAQKLVDQVLADYIFPDGCTYGYSGTLEMMNDAFSSLLTALVVAVLLVYMIMASQFESIRYPMIIMVSMPLAFTGAIFGLFLTGNTITMTSMMGFIMLAGMVVNNGIVLIDYTNQLMDRGINKYYLCHCCFPSLP